MARCKAWTLKLQRCRDSLCCDVVESENKMPTMRSTWDLGHLYLLVSQFAGDPKMIESMVLTIPKAKDCVLWTICLKPPSNCQMYLTHVPSDGCIKTKKHACIDRPCCCQWFEAPNSRCPLNRITRKGMGHWKPPKQTGQTRPPGSCRPARGLISSWVLNMINTVSTSVYHMIVYVCMRCLYDMFVRYVCMICVYDMFV
jgi:hypothetical protein